MRQPSKEDIWDVDTYNAGIWGLCNSSNTFKALTTLIFPHTRKVKAICED